MTATTLALPLRYRGTELIASGGMADVYGATDESLERRVAIKALNERFAHDPEIRLRFTREARIAAGLSNEPNVVTIYDVTDVGDRPAIVMEFLSGGTLADRLASGRVPPALALAWLEQAARGLDAAHAAGVIHRDVKPANLMLAGDGQVRVTDFGIARVVGDVALTSLGTILGTSGYMSPEQALGGKATAASDRYGLAVVAFELLTGRRPYLGETFAAEAAAHATAPIPAASHVDRSLPSSLDTILRRALAKEPSARHDSCGAMVEQLRAAFSESAGTTLRMAASAPTAPSAPSERLLRTVPPRRRAFVAGMAAIAVLGLLLAVVLSRNDGPPATATVVRATTVAGRQEVRTVTVETQVAAPSPAPSPSAAPATTPPATPSPATSALNGSALNAQGYRALQAGDVAAALPLLERAVSALQGSGSLDEAYASYNLALARFSSGSCDGVEELLDRSEQIQGKRSEINRLRKDARRGCEH